MTEKMYISGKCFCGQISVEEEYQSIEVVLVIAKTVNLAVRHLGQ